MIGDVASFAVDAISTAWQVTQNARADQLDALVADALAAIALANPAATFEGLDVSGGGDGETYSLSLLVDLAGASGPLVSDITAVFREAGSLGNAFVPANGCIAALQAAMAPVVPLCLYMGVTQAGSAGKMLFAMVAIPTPEPP